MVLFVGGLLAWVFLKDDRYLFIAVYGFAMMVPLSVMFVPSKYNSFLIYTIAMSVIGALALGAGFTNNISVFETLAIVFLIGFIAFQWLANFFMIRRSNK
jgi:hypothetical protein